jgi:general secretion pathway protein G
MPKHKQYGFTIVELLIVIVVIGVLAAITIVAYNGIQNRAHDTAIRSDLSTIAKKFEIFATTNNGLYPATVSDLQSLELKASSAAYAINPSVTRNHIYCPATSYQEYVILVKSKSGNGYIIRNNANTPQPFNTAWDGGTTAGYLCSSLGGAYTTASASGYWTGQTPNWHAWSGV